MDGIVIKGLTPAMYNAIKDGLKAERFNMEKAYKECLEMKLDDLAESYKKYAQTCSDALKIVDGAL